MPPAFDGGGVGTPCRPPTKAGAAGRRPHGQNFRCKYTGQEEDADTGLYYYKARYYDAALGRFIQPDSMGFPDQDAGMNRYMYVRGNPVGNIDPTGNYIYSLGIGGQVAVAWTYGMIKCGHPVYGNYTGDGHCHMENQQWSEKGLRDARWYIEDPTRSPFNRQQRRLYAAYVAYESYAKSVHPLTELDEISQWHDSNGPHLVGRDSYEQHGEYIRRSHRLWRPLASHNGRSFLGPSPIPTRHMRQATYKREYDALPKGATLRHARATINTVFTLSFEWVGTIFSTALFTFARLVVEGTTSEKQRNRHKMDAAAEYSLFRAAARGEDVGHVYVDQKVQEEKRKWVETQWEKISGELGLPYYPFWIIQALL